jgi:hypothetical protein
VVRRALYAARGVLSGSELDTVIAELREYGKNGIDPVNPFESIEATRLVNMSTRTASTMQESLRAQIKQEAMLSGHEPGQPLVLALDSIGHSQFSAAATAALERIDRSPAGRAALCIHLAQGERVRHSCNGTGARASANVLSIKAGADSGAVRALYATSPLLLKQEISGGSVAKLVILAAAADAGIAPDSLWCPKKVRDGDRFLRRVAFPREGYDACPNGVHAMSLSTATATSDNLAFYQLALALGEHNLARAARALGFEVPAGESLAYSLSFGTFALTPEQLLRAGQIVFGAAYNLNVVAEAPKVLLQKRQGNSRNLLQLRGILRTPEARAALRTLLEAPVTNAHGTMASLRNSIAAGKTGTVQSGVRDPDGNRYTHAKLALMYAPERRELMLLIIAAPLPSIPLATHDVPPSLFKPLFQLLINADKEPA